MNLGLNDPCWSWSTMGSFEEVLLENDAATDLIVHRYKKMYVSFVWNGVMEK